MLVAVRGIPKDFESRKWIRNNYGKFRSNDTALIFLLGNDKPMKNSSKVFSVEDSFTDIQPVNGWGFFISGKNTVQDMFDVMRYKSPFMTSENFRRIPDDTIITGEIRVLANVSMKNNPGFGYMRPSLWFDPIANKSVPLMSSNANRETLWKQFIQGGRK
uniref:Uncharacterized protein n=1 Tax=Acrobeloides nanus TaxID=290746 RepID=A0A914EH68_9BILA